MSPEFEALQQIAGYWRERGLSTRLTWVFGLGRRRRMTRNVLGLRE